MAYCRCDGEPLGSSDHCAVCYCEEFEERCATACCFERSTGELRGASLRYPSERLARAAAHDARRDTGEAHGIVFLGHGVVTIRPTSARAAYRQARRALQA